MQRLDSIDCPRVMCNTKHNNILYIDIYFFYFILIKLTVYKEIIAYTAVYH